MFTALPKYIKFHILTSLNWLELKKCTLISHEWHDLLNNDEFWKYKLRQDYSMVDNTINVSWRTWYHRVANSGALCRYENGKISAIHPENVYKISSCSGRNYYLDIFGHLYFAPDFIPDQNEDWFGSSQICRGPPLHLLNLRTPVFSQILNQVKHIIPTNTGDFILTFDSELYAYTDNGRVLIAPSVKMIYGNDRHLVYQTHHLDLYYVEFEKELPNRLRSKFLQSNVSLVGRVRNYLDVLDCDILTTHWHTYKTYDHNYRLYPDPIRYHVNTDCDLVDRAILKVIDKNVRTVMGCHVPIYIKYRPTFAKK